MEFPREISATFYLNKKAYASFVNDLSKLPYARVSTTIIERGTSEEYCVSIATTVWLEDTETLGVYKMMLEVTFTVFVVSARKKRKRMKR